MGLETHVLKLFLSSFFHAPFGNKKMRRRSSQGHGAGGAPKKRPSVLDLLRTGSSKDQPIAAPPVANRIPVEEMLTKSLHLRGLNVPWPFSQLMLLRWKTKEIRTYPLGHRGIAHADEDLWLVETPGPSENQETKKHTLSKRIVFVCGRTLTYESQRSCAACS